MIRKGKTPRQMKSKQSKCLMQRITSHSKFAFVTPGKNMYLFIFFWLVCFFIIFIMFIIYYCYDLLLLIIIYNIISLQQSLLCRQYVFLVKKKKEKKHILCTWRTKRSLSSISHYIDLFSVCGFNALLYILAKRRRTLVGWMAAGCGFIR